jgi:hypothetical protein
MAKCQCSKQSDECPCRNEISQEDLLCDLCREGCTAGCWIEFGGEIGTETWHVATTWQEIRRLESLSTFQR